MFHMVASLSSAVRVPVFCKIRLLSSLRKVTSPSLHSLQMEHKEESKSAFC